MPAIRRFASIPFALALLCVLPAFGADVLEKSKRVRVVFTSGTELSGTLVDLIGSTIRVRLKLNERPVSYKASDIDSIVCNDKTYKFDGDNRRWVAEEGVAPKEKKPAKVVASKEKGTAKTTATKEKPPPAAPATQTVTGEGVGTTPEEARKDAIREAVRKVAGALVVGTTTVENDKIIKDKVLTYSDGVIVGDSYKEVERKQEGDIWRIKISATVINRKLAERLVAAGFELRKIDGEGIAAAVMSRVEARKRATELLQAALEDLPKIVVAEAAKPTENDYDEDTGELKVTIRVGADVRRYEAVTKRLLPVLDLVCVDGSRFTFAGKLGTEKKLAAARKGKAGRPAGKGDAMLSLFPVEVQQKADMYFQLALPEERKGWYMWVMTNCKEDYSAVAWKVYHLDCARGEAVKHLAGKPMLVVTLLDKDKNALVTKEIDLSRVDYRGSVNGWAFHHTTTQAKTSRGVEMRATANVAVAPLYLLGKTFSGMQGVKVSIKIGQAELRKLDRIRCEVEFRE